MMCEHCGKNAANFYYKSNINGKVSQVNLCTHCARELGYDKNMNFSLDGWMNDVFDTFSEASLFAPRRNMLGGWAVPDLSAMLGEKESEEKSGAVLLDAEEEEELSRLRRLNALRQELQSAVAAENFERAIELRDEIRGGEGGC